MKKIILCGMISISVCICLLFVTSLIPKKMIADNSKKSAEYLAEKELFDRVTKQSFLSRQDNYADSIWLNIIYCIDDSRLVESAIRCSYYCPENIGANEAYKIITNMPENDFKDICNQSISGKTAEMVDYSRYWHGAMVVIRPLLMVLSVKGIRLLLGGVYLMLSGVLVAFMFKDGRKALGISYIIGMTVTSQWMFAFCLEYVMSFLVMAVLMLAYYLIRENKSDEGSQDILLYEIVCIGGVVTAFVDFLTTETITCLMPLLLYFILNWEDSNDNKKTFKTETIVMMKAGVCWGISYAVMIVFKWVIAMAVIGKKAFTDAISQAALRMNGEATYGNVTGAANVPVSERLFGAVWRNLGCLFPFRDTMRPGVVMLCTFGVAFGIFSIWYLFHKRVSERDKISIFIILLVGLVPYFRFLAINNHSYIHFFFTYRAQFATMFGIMYIVCKDLVVNKKKK